MKIPLQLENVDLSFLENLWNALLSFLPKLLLVLVILILGWIITKIVQYITTKTLRVTKIDKWTDSLNEIEFLHKNDIHIDLTKIIITVVKWIVILFVVVTISEILGLKVIAQEIENFIGYIPKLLSAIAIFTIGVYIANLIRNAIHKVFHSFNLGGSKVIGNIVFYILFVIITITALNQGGVNTEVISNNLTLILAALLLAFAIAFGLGSRDIIQRLLLGFYTRKTLAVGDIIKVGNIEGTIIAIDNINLVLSSKDEKYVFPVKMINDTVIEVLTKK